MKQHISLYNFRGAFMASDTYKNNFSYEALGALYDYLTELEDCIGEESDFDMVAICCDYSEYYDWADFRNNYSAFVESELIRNIDDLRDFTTVIPVEGTTGFVIQDF
jgi:hypothetical protein